MKDKKSYITYKFLHFSAPRRHF